MFALLLILAACREVEYPPVFDRDGHGTDLGNTCIRLRDLGCPEGAALFADRTCYEHLVDVSALTVVPSDCVKDAKNQADVRRCGGPSTLRFLCGNEESDSPE